MLVRTIECVQGTVQVEAVCEPVFEYGSSPGKRRMLEDDWGRAEVSCGEMKLG